MRREPGRRASRKSKVDGLLVVKEFEVAEQISGDAIGFGLGVKLVELFGDLVNGVVAVAELNNFEARPLQAERLLRGKERARKFGLFVEAYAGSQAWSGGEFRLHRISSLARES